MIRAPGDSIGCKKLWAAVLSTLLTDALSPSNGKQVSRDRDEALAWLARRTPAKDRVIQNAGIDPDWFWICWQTGRAHRPETRGRRAVR